MSKDHLSAEALFEHVQDATYFHVPPEVGALFGAGDEDGQHSSHLNLPQPLATPKTDAAGNVLIDHHTHGPVYETIWAPNTGHPVIDDSILPLDFVFTKFMAIELAVALICVLLFGWLASHIRGGRASRGRLSNMLEAFVVFIRDDVAKTAIGDHGYEKFVPLLCSLFFFVLGCNLFGMLPWMGSPTGVLATTAALALATFLAVVTSGVKELGFAGFLAAQAPSMDLPPPIKVVLLPMIWVIEVFSLFLKHGVLAVRLLANMVAGHLILAVLVGFIGAAWTLGLVWWVVMPVSIAGAVAISVLELFVAFLQAYVFTFLSALFIGAAVHPH
ncbi:MAG: F0F1 ATP synthase subunit A [Planctomycetota bacterium]